MIIVIVFVIILFVLGGIIGGFYFTYTLVKPYIKSKDGRKTLLKYVLILCIISWGGAALGWFLMRQPDYFEQGIDQLHKSKYIAQKIGDFNSYSFYDRQLVKNPKNPVNFNVQINGDSLNLYLTCTMKKYKDQWLLVYIKEDSTSVAKDK